MSDYELIQLDENEVDRLMNFIKENPLKKFASIDSITLAVKYEDMKICSLQISSIFGRTEYTVAVIMPDRIIPAKCFSELKSGKRGLCESTGNAEIDNILNDVCRMFHLFEEDTFAEIISKYSDGSEEWEEYGEKYEEMRSQIMDFEYKMRKKYNIEK